MQKFSRLKTSAFKNLKKAVQDAVECAADPHAALVPHAQPSREAIRRVVIIAHRGAHREVLPHGQRSDQPSGRLSASRSLPENTLAAFDAAAMGGADGIEFDVRWTADEVLVICHDLTAKRVFQKSLRIMKTKFNRLRLIVPDIPTLNEVVMRYNGPQQMQGSVARGLHLMIELKGAKPGSRHGWTPERLERLAGELQSLTPVADYHLMSLNPKTLMAAEASGLFKPEALLSIATTNTHRISRITLSKKWGGITGHYVLLSKKIQNVHLKKGQKMGVGFVQSANSFRRQIDRGADWVFTNDAVKLAQLRKTWLEDAGKKI